MSKNKTLSTAKSARNDERCTQYADIHKEANAYLGCGSDASRGKAVLLPCDDPEWSCFLRFFFAHNFATQVLKKSFSTNCALDAKKEKFCIVYPYDALGRPTQRNSDSFGYNDRSEVTSAVVSNWTWNYSYDEIGNQSWGRANCVNQYADDEYDEDGNTILYYPGSGTEAGYSYDAANRLETFAINGCLLMINRYDSKSRRVQKIAPDSTSTFFYDAWNLIEERIACTNGTSSAIRYCWGRDLSGTLQGAGGVGGLLYLTVDGAIYIPCYDNIGNVTRYLDANGNAVAQYAYDAFGNCISKSGPLADFFRHRFSTKYFDVETGLYYYGYRFYHPILMRWLNRDPLGEEGGLNLYEFCSNAAVIYADFLGNVPSGSTFSNAYSPYDYNHNGREIWRAVGGSLKRHLWNDETVEPPNSCATRVSIALIKSNDPIPNGSRQYINTLKRGEKGIAGNYIVGAGKMQDYLTSVWGTTGKLSPIHAYYFVSKVKKGDISGLRKEIEEKLKCSNVPKDKYVCVVSSKVKDEPGVSGHIGMVTKTYADRYMPYRDNPVVWILPPTKKATHQKK